MTPGLNEAEPGLKGCGGGVAVTWGWALGGTESVQKPCGQLTGAEFAGEPLCQLASLSELLPEALPQVVVNVIAP